MAAVCEDRQKQRAVTGRWRASVMHTKRFTKQVVQTILCSLRMTEMYFFRTIRLRHFKPETRRQSIWWHHANSQKGEEIQGCASSKKGHG